MSPNPPTCTCTCVSRRHQSFWPCPTVYIRNITIEEVLGQYSYQCMLELCSLVPSPKGSGDETRRYESLIHAGINTSSSLRLSLQGIHYRLVYSALPTSNHSLHTYCFYRQTLCRSLTASKNKSMTSDTELI